MAQIIKTISDFSQLSTWGVRYIGGSGFVISPAVSTKEDKKSVTLSGIPAGSTINSAKITALFGSPNTGYAIRTVAFSKDGTNYSDNTIWDVAGTADSVPAEETIPVGYITPGGTLYVKFRFKANGSTSGGEGSKSSSLTIKNITITVTYTPPHTKPTVANVKLGGGTSAVYSGASTDATLSWSGTAGSYNTISRYLVYRSVNGGAYAKLGETTSTSMTVKSPATAGQHHRYYVIAVGEYSNSDAVYSPYHYTYKAPGAPTGLSFNPTSVVQGQKATLSWTAGTAGVGVGTSKYEVYRGSTLVGSTTETSLQITAPGTVGTHSHTVRAVGSVAGYNSPSSSAVSLSTTAAPAPAMGNVTLAATHVAAGANTTLKWTATPHATNPITKYRVYRSVAGATYTHLSDTTGTSLTVAGPGTAGQNHRYYVIAIGTYSNSSAAYSPHLYAYKAPGAPTGVSLNPATVFTGKTTRVSWTAGAAGVGVSVSKYEVYRAGVLVGSTTSLYLDVTAPATAGTYSYTVKAIGNVSGYNSGASSAVNLSVQNPASTGSLDRTTVQMDGSSTIRLTVSSADSTFTHKAVWKAGGATITQSLAAGTASTTLTVPLAWCAQFPNTTSGQASVTLESYSGSTKTGENTYAFTVTVPNSVVPTFASLGASLVANGVDASITKYVQGYSSVKLTINSPAGAQGSSIKSYSISGGGFAASASQTTTYGVLNTPGSITFTGKITDSRGRTATKTVTITVEPYGSPSLSGAVAYRCNSSGAKLSSGTYALLKATSVFSSIGGQNTATLRGRVYMKGATPGAWQNMTSGANLVTGSGNILVVKTYIAEITIADKISNFTLTYTIPTDTPSFHALDGALGAGIGKYAETPKALEIPGDWSFRRGAYVGLDSGNYGGYVTPGGIGAAASSHSHSYIPLNTAFVADLNALTANGVYRQEQPSSGYPYTTTLNLTSSDGRQQLTIARDGSGMKFRGVTSGSGTTGWTAWKDVLHSGNYNSYAPTKTGTGASGTWGISITGNAATATKLASSRTFTIGSTGKTFNGSANVSWTLAEIGAAASSHSHNYLPLETLPSVSTVAYGMQKRQISGDNAPNGRNPYVITHHTGLSLSAHTAYGGVRLFTQLAGSPYSHAGTLVAQFSTDIDLYKQVNIRGGMSFPANTNNPRIIFTPSDGTLGFAVDGTGDGYQTGLVIGGTSKNLLYLGNQVLDSSNYTSYAQKKIAYGTSLPTSGMATGDIFIKI